MAEKVQNGSPPLPGPANLAFVESLYEDFARDPSSVPPDWQRYFSELGDGELRFPKPRFTPSFKPFSIFNPPGGMESAASAGFCSGERSYPGSHLSAHPSLPRARPSHRPGRSARACLNRFRPSWSPNSLASPKPTWTCRSTAKLFNMMAR